MKTKMRMPLLIKIEIIFIIIGIFAFAIMSIPIFYHESMTLEQINYFRKNSIFSLVIKIGAILGLFSMILFLINSIFLKFRFWVLRLILIFIMIVIMGFQY